MRTHNKIRNKASATSKVLSVIITLTLILTLTPIVLGEQSATSTIELNKQFTFSVPQLQDSEDGYTSIVVEGASEKTIATGSPQLPYSIYRFELPLGAQDIAVNIEHSTIQTITFEGDIQPGPFKAPLIYEKEQRPVLSKLSSALQNKYGQPNTQTQTSVRSLNPEDIPMIKTVDFGKYSMYVGRNENHELKTFVITTIYPCTILNNQLQYITSATASVAYTSPLGALEDEEETYDLLIISANDFASDLLPLAEHKEAMGLKTKLVTIQEIIDEIYFEKSEEYSRDTQEQIKYFIYNAIQEWDVTYVMAVGGYRTFFGLNNPDKQFPIRFSHLNDGAEPGYASDQYYSSCIMYDEDDSINFDSWDSNGNGRFAEWDWVGFDSYDPYPDVYFGRLACRNRIEVRTMVNKIITYETETYNSEWFNRFLTITGDGFGDLGDLALQWNTNNVPAGDYTIYGQSRTVDQPYVYGPIDSVTVTVDHSAESRVTFYEDDHLKIEPLTEEQETLYPGKPVLEIVTPQDDDILGNTDVNFNPPEAYCSDYTDWGRVEYVNGIMYIRSKSYDPKTQETGDRGSHTQVHIWVNNSDGQTVLNSPNFFSNTWYEGELECLKAIDYLNTFETTKLFASNGNWYNIHDVIDGFSEGYGFVYFAGHGNPMSWGDHLPGIPGGRDDGMINGMKNINLDFGIARYEGDEGDPMFPMDALTNGDMQPVTLVGGCHNSFIDASLMKLWVEPEEVLFTVLHGGWVPECFDWWLARMPQGGAIATIGCAGLGYGILGQQATSGLGGWINPEFFRVYKYGQKVLGATFTHTLMNYATNFDCMGDQTDRKTFEEWVLLGDPSLKIGGYPPEEETGILADQQSELTPASLSEATISMSTPTNHLPSNPVQSLDGTEYQVTSNLGEDISPQHIISDDSGRFLVGYSYATPSGEDVHPGFAISHGGALWDELVFANPVESGYSSYDTFGIGDKENHIMTICFDASNFGAFFMGDFTNPNTWSGPRWYFPSGVFSNIGKDGVAVTGYYDTNGDPQFGGVWSVKYMATEGAIAMFSVGGVDHIITEPVKNIRGDSDDTTGWHFYGVQSKQHEYGWIIRGNPPGTFLVTAISEFTNPDVTANNGWTYIVSENQSGVVECRYSNNNGGTWGVSQVISSGHHPKVLIEEDGSVVCYYTVGNNIWKARSEDHGLTWSTPEQLMGITVDGSHYSPFELTEHAIIYAKNDGNLYAQIFSETVGAQIGMIDVDSSGRSVISTIYNSGTTYLVNATWEIQMEGASPLGRYFGLAGTMFENIFKGRILTGGMATGSMWLSSAEYEDISLGSTFGLGHIMVTVRVLYDDDVLAEKSEDGFLLGSRILLHHGEE